MDLIRVAEAPFLKRKPPSFRPGDTVKVHAKVIEGDKERIQVFEGTVIARKGGALSETFIVRRISYGIGVERGFLLHSPRIARIDVVRSGKVRRAKLFYLRSRGGRDAKITEEREVRAGDAAAASIPVSAESQTAAPASPATAAAAPAAG